MKMEADNLNNSQKQQCNINDVSILLPTLEEVATALNKYREKKSISGYSTMEYKTTTKMV